MTATFKTMYKDPGMWVENKEERAVVNFTDKEEMHSFLTLLKFKFWPEHNEYTKRIAWDKMEVVTII